MIEHLWQRHPKAVMSVCAACGRHWWPETQEKPTDPCTDVRKPVEA